MKGKPRIIRALASCRRVFLLLLLGITLLFAGIYSQAPKLDELRPQIESYLKQELQLSELKLGPLSWYWAGFLWLDSEQLDFTSANNNLAFHHGGVAIRISILSLLQGSLAPDSIRLSGGDLKLNIPEQTGAELGLPSHQLRLDEVNVHWQFGGWKGVLAGLQLRLDGPNRSLKANSPALRLTAHLDEDGLPASANLHCQHTDWLPKALRSKIQGTPTLDMGLSRLGPRQWNVSASLKSEQVITLMPDSIYSLPLNSLSARIVLQTKTDNPLHAETINITESTWSLGPDKVSQNGQWNKGILKLHASSAHLPLPLVWSALRPLGAAKWHHWLGLMQQGSATAIEGELTLPLSDPLQSPTLQANYDKLSFKVHANIHDADIALGSSGDRLGQLSASVDIDEQGLSARIDDSLLPHQLGHSAGSLYLPWSTLELQIKGHAQIDAAHLLAWRGPEQMQDWQWQQGASDASYAIKWLIHEPEPHVATARLQPTDVWKVSINGMEFGLTGGMVDWNQDSGVDIEQMQVMGERLQGTLSMTAAPDRDKQWQLLSLDAQGQSDLSTIASHFQLPMSNASGLLSVSLDYHETWSGKLDLTQSSWDHLLGSSKSIGEPFALLYKGRFKPDSDIPTLELTRMYSQGDILQANGEASLNREGLQLNFKHLKTPAFDGALDIKAPFGDAPWEIDANADYLNRQALPNALDHVRSKDDKHWAIRARIQRFDWADAHMSGVHVKLASAPGSSGTFEASQIHTSKLDILDANAIFAMLGNGEIDLRRLNANVEKQHLSMTAHLTPEKAGGIRWQGFATIEGAFGHLMQRGKLSEKFKSGSGHVLFSGQGVMLREQPWWQGMNGRLRLRVDDGRILEGGTMTTFLSAISLADLPHLLIGKRKDLSGPGIMFKRLQMEGVLQGQNIRIRNLAMRSSAFDLAGHGTMDIDKDLIDLYVIARPLQNLDAILAKIPLLRDLLGGKAHSFMRKIYRMHGPFTDAKVDSVAPEEAGLESSGLIEALFSLPEHWFGKADKPPAQSNP